MGGGGEEEKKKVEAVSDVMRSKDQEQRNKA